ncbi:arsenite efflux transporter metallochaperone ArsD [Luteococcus peritonei]|uniref:arsenite efflux transporter metallochaperone ArsD n=1 Tax=Luteococcus peritonei TaxID=88874 RepID=UPI0031D7CACF
MPSIRVFEPALCCNTGVCGDDVDQALVDFTADLNALKDAGADIARTNLGTDPQAFTANPQAVTFVQTVGSEGLPLTLVDGVTVLTGRYPTRDELRRWAGMGTPVPSTGHTPLQMAGDSGDCCGGTGCC